MSWFFGQEACGILVPQPGIEPAPPALGGEILTTGPPEKSPVLFFNSTNTLSKSNGMYLAVQPANGNRTNVLFAQLKYAVSSLPTSLYSILLILLLSQVLCIAPYTYAEKFYRGFYYFLWDCHCYQRGYVTCSLHRKQVVKQRFKHRSIQRRSLNTWSLASIM